MDALYVAQVIKKRSASPLSSLPVPVGRFLQTAEPF